MLRNSELKEDGEEELRDECLLIKHLDLGMIRRYVHIC